MPARPFSLSRLPLPALLVLLAACGNDGRSPAGPAPEPPPPAALSAASGQGQSGLAGSPLPAEVVVMVTGARWS